MEISNPQELSKARINKDQLISVTLRIAYIITAYSSFKHLAKLIESLCYGNILIFIHVDKKYNMPSKINKCDLVIFIKRIKVWWGGWSHQKAIINLMLEAVKYNFDYYILLSGTDYPIRPAKFLYKKLEEGGEYLNIIKGFQTHKPESRVKYYYFDCFDRRDVSNFKAQFFLKLEQWQRKLLIKREYPFQTIFHGSTWWALSHNCVTYVLNYIANNKDYVRFFKTCWCPEESFIPTIIGNSPFLGLCKGNLTYTDWSSSSGPALINKNHLRLFKQQSEFRNEYGKYTPCFARKFNDNSEDIIEQIDRELR